MKDFFKTIGEWLMVPTIINLCIAIWRGNIIMDQLKEQPEALKDFYNALGFNINVYHLIALDFTLSMLFFMIVMAFIGLVI